MASGTRVATFREAVRKRDRRCVITGRLAFDADYGMWICFEAVHIFPLAYENQWIKNGYGRWITLPSAGESINSVQNGMLLDNTIHTLFDNYIISIAINPDVCMSLYH